VGARPFSRRVDPGRSRLSSSAESSASAPSTSTAPAPCQAARGDFVAGFLTWIGDLEDDVHAGRRHGGRRPCRHTFLKGITEDKVPALDRSFHKSGNGVEPLLPSVVTAMDVAQSRRYGPRHLASATRAAAGGEFGRGAVRTPAMSWGVGKSLHQQWVTQLEDFGATPTEASLCHDRSTIRG
jgi:hypothetical protein